MMPTCDRCGVSLYYPNNVIGKESVCTNCFQKEKEKMFEDTEQVKETVNQDIKRDLKADLELCEKTKPISDEMKKVLITRMARSNMKSSESTRLILEAIDGWPHAIERALEAEKRVEELENQVDILSTTLNMYCSPYYDMRERAEKAEALVRELVYSLKLIRGSSQFSHTTWEEITDLANIALIGAEEVLGDDALRVR